MAAPPNRGSRFRQLGPPAYRSSLDYLPPVAFETAPGSAIVCQLKRWQVSPAPGKPGHASPVQTLDAGNSHLCESCVMPKHKLPPWLRPKTAPRLVELGVAWYTESEWALVKAAATDPRTLRSPRTRSGFKWRRNRCSTFSLPESCRTREFISANELLRVVVGPPRARDDLSLHCLSEPQPGPRIGKWAVRAHASTCSPPATPELFSPRSSGPSKAAEPRAVARCPARVRKACLNLFPKVSCSRAAQARGVDIGPTLCHSQGRTRQASERLENKAQT